MSDIQEAAAPTIKEEKWGIQYSVRFEKTDPGKNGAAIRQTTIMEGLVVGPFRSREIAENALLVLMAHTDGLMGAQIAQMIEGSRPERQTPPAEEILREMQKNGHVPPDATLKVEGEAPDNTVPFPAAKPE